VKKQNREEAKQNKIWLCLATLPFVANFFDFISVFFDDERNPNCDERERDEMFSWKNHFSSSRREENVVR